MKCLITLNQLMVKYLVNKIIIDLDNTAYGTKEAQSAANRKTTQEAA